MAAKKKKSAKKGAQHARWPSLLVCLGLAGALFYAGSKAVAWAKQRPDWSFDPMRVALRTSGPDWFAAPMARAFYDSYARASAIEPFSLLDKERLRAWVDRVRELPWIERLEVLPRYPDRVHLDLELRRPVAAFAIGSGDAKSLVLLDASGIPLPLRNADARLAGDPARLFDEASRGASDLPRRPFDLPWVLGLAPVETDRDAARAASALAVEWVDEVQPRLRRLRRGAVPRLYAIDVENHGLRADARASEYSLVVKSSDHRPVWIAWGHAPGGAYPRRISLDAKVRTLALALEAYAGLRGVRRLDARYRESWRQRVEVVVDPGGAARRGR